MPVTPDEFSDFIKHERKKLLQSLRRINPVCAEDAIHDAIVRILPKLSNFESCAQIQSYIWKTATGLAKGCGGGRTPVLHVPISHTDDEEGEVLLNDPTEPWQILAARELLPILVRVLDEIAAKLANHPELSEMLALIFDYLEQPEHDELPSMRSYVVEKMFMRSSPDTSHGRVEVDSRRESLEKSYKNLYERIGRMSKGAFNSFEQATSTTIQEKLFAGRQGERMQVVSEEHAPVLDIGWDASANDGSDGLGEDEGDVDATTESL